MGIDFGYECNSNLEGLMNLLVVDWRNPLEEDFGFSGVHGRVDPVGPSSQALLKRYQTIHVLVNLVPILNKIPSAKPDQTD